MEWKISEHPVDYPEALAFMEGRVSDIQSHQATELAWLLEHPPLYTAGTSANTTDLLDKSRFPVYPTGRGGQYTYHGPGQRIAYMMMDLRKRTQDVRRFVSDLEQVIIDTLAAFEIMGERCQGRIGIWVVDTKGNESKIAALGIRIKRWVTYHGISVNINPDLSHYNGIIPCGISEYGVTSMANLGVEINKEMFDQQFIKSCEGIFG